MNEVFRVELFGEKTDRWCELELPASYYGLQDALDKIQMPFPNSRQLSLQRIVTISLPRSGLRKIWMTICSSLISEPPRR